MNRSIITRREAHELGLKRFYTGTSCLRNHDSERFTSSGACIACQNFKTPNKRQGPRARNVGWPSRGLIFQVADVTPEEMASAFRYIEHMRWHDFAVMELRKDAKLAVQFTEIMPVQERAKLMMTLERQEEAARALRKRLAGES